MHTHSAELPFFTTGELACKCCGQIAIDIRAAVHLPLLRYTWAKPFTFSSFCRCPAHNKAEGGHHRSLHLTVNPVWPTFGAIAGDVKWADWPTETKLKFARLAWSLGWSIGLNDYFCHIDGRLWLNCGLEQRVFYYTDWAGLFGADEIKYRH